MTQLLGPFTQILPMTDLANKGPLNPDGMPIIDNGGIVVDNGHIISVGNYQELSKSNHEKISFEHPTVAIPSLIDAHTHICFAGSRSSDYTKRLNGKSYQEISAEGGGILDTVRHTRKASEEELVEGILARCETLLSQGVGTCEVKSGYGLTVDDELKMLRAIKIANKQTPITLVPTCLAAHTLPPEFTYAPDYLNHLLSDLLPQVQKESLANRVDIFVEKGAFSVNDARHYLHVAHDMGFALTIHADQFSKGGGFLAADVHALSADHLEASKESTLRALRDGGVIPLVLPGASIGLGIPFAPARKILDVGLPLVIASDWNPGSAPMGDLLTQASILAAYEKLNACEVFAAMTARAALALEMSDHGSLAPGKVADITLFPTDDYREILYHQGTLKPCHTILSGKTQWSAFDGVAKNKKLSTC
ncbi:Imidazolonepropionase [Chlamydiales bacterium SCGC AG-110-M15]|nr:Imidazolonepropionase [Chlamydiales bacterium SCGC AG-110-M15]